MGVCKCKRAGKVHFPGKKNRKGEIDVSPTYGAAFYCRKKRRNCWRTVLRKRIPAAILVKTLFPGRNLHLNSRCPFGKTKNGQFFWANLSSFLGGPYNLMRRRGGGSCSLRATTARGRKPDSVCVAQKVPFAFLFNFLGSLSSHSFSKCSFRSRLLLSALKRQGGGQSE